MAGIIHGIAMGNPPFPEKNSLIFFKRNCQHSTCRLANLSCRCCRKVSRNSVFARDVTKSTIVCRSGHLNRHQLPSMSMNIRSHLQGSQSPKMVWPIT